jgi:hypothetical protein
MSLPLDLLRKMQAGDAVVAWQAMVSHAWNVCRQPLETGRARTEVLNRDRLLASVDYALATGCWTLWGQYEDCVEKTADCLCDWWESTGIGRAILILDALSLRETPWLLGSAVARGYKVHSARATGAELPADTTPFAKALGYGQRSALESNGGTTGRLTGAATESVALPWRDCCGLVGPQPDLVFWHHWPDSRLHDLGVPGEGVERLSEEAGTTLCGDDFWDFVEHLTQGRRLVITGDHGYAASGLFPDVGDEEQGNYLKNRFKARRWMPGGNDKEAWTPPISLALESRHGKHEYVLGRRKWKTSGGYPTLTHGGLSLLEVLVPWIELSR